MRRPGFLEHVRHPGLPPGDDLSEPEVCASTGVAPKARAFASRHALAFALVTALSLAAPAGCGGIDETALVGLENCANGVDDNGDGLTDCGDPQCVGHAYCLGYVELACDNGADDDGDGDVDCEDADCNQDPACHPEVELVCNDGLDNDGDGLTDCQDDDCAQAGTCQEICDDGLDNDGDGDVDCQDVDCTGALGCVPERCDNGVDDDADGDVDCEDIDCRFAPPCNLVELCNNGADDDGDGLTDCNDPDCQTSPWCTELDCVDGLDNDANGLTDCDDPACAGQLGCTPNTTCKPATLLYCDSYVPGTTLGRLDNLQDYGCVGTMLSGPEAYFKLSIFPGTVITVFLSDYSSGGELNLLALPGDEGAPGCDALGDCLSSSHAGGNDRSLTLVPEGVTDVYLVVDSPTSPGDFDLVVYCDPLVEVDCEDGFDDDGDGMTDCEDPDCWLSGVCVMPMEDCEDGVDNNLDGLIDCADPECYGAAACANAESICYDGADNDSDGLIDCADPDCYLDFSCAGGEVSCTNGVDDDNDGYPDCYDFDCSDSYYCAYWFDFDQVCSDDSECGQPDHTCVWLSNGTIGSCTRPCSTPGLWGGECDTATSPQGICAPDLQNGGGFCVLPCGMGYPGHSCPTGWSCTIPDPGFPGQGVCTP